MKSGPKKKPKPEKIDGLSPDDIEKIRKAIRQTWSWSHPRRLCLKRALTPEGFSICEECKQVVAKVYVDHKIAVGKVDSGFIERLYCPSSGLTALCGSCHGKKTRQERKELALANQKARP